MLAEALHSVVDTGNSVMLWRGVRRSRRPAHARHPYGHGKELYFWSFVVAVSMFSVGGVVSIYEGIGRILQPQEPTKLDLPLPLHKREFEVVIIIAVVSGEMVGAD